MLDASEFKFHYEIEKQFKEAEEYRREIPIFIKDIQSATHPHAVYTSWLLNSSTKDLPNSECLDCSITDNFNDESNI
jgi:hypothetical protein